VLEKLPIEHGDVVVNYLWGLKYWNKLEYKFYGIIFVITPHKFSESGIHQNYMTEKFRYIYIRG
jgi:hypothetical protein